MEINVILNSKITMNEVKINIWDLFCGMVRKFVLI